MKLKDLDLINIDEFELTWRWTDPNYCQMKEDDLNRIKPLSINSANVVDKKALSFLEANSCSVNSIFFENIDSIETSQSITNVTIWLQNKLEKSEIIISWNSDLAVITDAELFIKYWDDFCYSSSDDVTIWPFDESWVLSYCHYEQFWYGCSKNL